jgi:hypothetical protein
VAVGTAAAISATGTAPGPEQVDNETMMQVTIQEPFTDMPDQWQLVGATQLEDATWSVEALNQRGNVLRRVDASGANVTETFNIDNDTSSINVTVTGTVPPLETFDYENRSTENYTVMSLQQANGNSFDRVWRSHRYTADSRSARTAIEQAQAAVEDADGSAGQDDLDRAINAYDAGNFDNAESLAEEARNAAEQSQGGLPIVLIGGAVVVILLVAAGGYYYYQSQQGGDYKLQ